VIAESREQCRNLVVRHLATAAQASALHWKTVREVLANGGREESHQGRMIFVRCRYCERVTRVQGDVLRYTCTCRPNETQITFQNRTIQI
jgi:hypothetical protein